MNLNYKNTAYDAGYLESVMSVHECMFSRLLIEKPKYDLFSMIDNYMMQSEVRYKMDKGNWSALNKGYKQLINSIDFSSCKPNTGNNALFDDIILGWMADMYVLLQWRYNIMSSEIIKKIPSKTMYAIYNPLHETSYENACEKLYHKFLTNS